MDPGVTTSVAHTLFLAGEYAAAIESYSGRAAYYLDAASWAALGKREVAVALLRERLGRIPLSRLMTALMSSLLALLEGRTDEAVRLMETADTTCEPEILLYFARHYAQMRLTDPALKAVKKAAQSGFTCAPNTLNWDPWLGALQEHLEFESLLGAAAARVEEPRSSFELHTTPPKRSPF
jgi:tetratricopeptide (TPR) repeat protein